MSHPNKAKGTRWESEVAEYLGLERIGAIYGSNDQGDLRHWRWVIECKNEKQLSLAEYMNELKAEMTNAEKDRGVAVVKRRRGKGSTGQIDDAYAVMPLWVFRRVLEQLGGR